MSTVLLSAGNATRLGGGCKALQRIGGETMAERWHAVDPKLTIVCRTEHTDDGLLNEYDVMHFDEGGGPARALRSVLAYVDTPLTVAYADTWLPYSAIPEGDDWCGVAAARGGRRWDVAEGGVAVSRQVPIDQVVTACIGLYRFSDLSKLRRALDVAIGITDGGEVGMAPVVTLYGSPFVPVVGWQDVGDPAALAAWRPL